MPLTNVRCTRIPVLEMKYLAGELVSELADIDSKDPLTSWGCIKRLISDLQLQVEKAER